MTIHVSFNDRTKPQHQRAMMCSIDVEASDTIDIVRNKIADGLGFEIGLEYKLMLGLGKTILEENAHVRDYAFDELDCILFVRRREPKRKRRE